MLCTLLTERTVQRSAVLAVLLLNELDQKIILVLRKVTSLKPQDESFR